MKYLNLDDISLDRMRHDPDSRRAYLDLICYIHERVLSELTHTQATELDSHHVNYGLGQVQYAFGSSQQIGIAARKNIITAEGIVTALSANSTDAHRKNIEIKAGKFIQKAMEEYEEIRNILCEPRVNKQK